MHPETSTPPYASALGQGNKPSTLTDAASQLCSRLDHVLDRCVQIGDTLYGSEPREAGAQVAGPSPVPAMNRTLEAAHHYVSRIENELSRIQNKL